MLITGEVADKSVNAVGYCLQCESLVGLGGGRWCKTVGRLTSPGVKCVVTPDGMVGWVAQLEVGQRAAADLDIVCWHTPFAQAGLGVVAKERRVVEVGCVCASSR